MFPSQYFAPVYYPRNYFPGTIAEKARYFFHGAFPLSYYSDPYFPGDFVAIVEPPVEPPTQAVGGVSRPFPRVAPAVHGYADFELPVPALSAFGFITPADIAATLQAEVVRLTFSAVGTMAAAGVVSFLEASGPVVRLTAVGTTSRRRITGRSKADEEAEEQALLEHYLMSLKDS